MYQARPKRVPEDCHGNSNWFCNHGLHWLLCQTDPHPHQQHYCGRLNLSGE